MRRVLSIAAVLLAAPFGRAQVAPPALPHSLFDQPPAAPVVSYAGGKLTIQATNSSLRAILDRLEAATGAKVEGLGQDQRIFGVYGPGAPQEVLSSLLDDSGYNVLIAGKLPDGAPREVVLSTRDAGASGAASNTQQPTQAAQETDDGSDQAEPSPPQPALVGPGGQGFPQPAAQQPNAQGQNNQQVKTPQQILDELQRLRLSQPPPQ